MWPSMSRFITDSFVNPLDPKGLRSMKRHAVAGLACRLGGTRLYGKPLQPLGPDVSILEQIVLCLRGESFIEEIVLAIAEDRENRWLSELASELGCTYVFGDTDDVLARLIRAGESVGATDMVRKTTESPFVEFSGLAE